MQFSALIRSFANFYTPQNVFSKCFTPIPNSDYNFVHKTPEKMFSELKTYKSLMHSENLLACKLSGNKTFTVVYNF